MGESLEREFSKLEQQRSQTARIRMRNEQALSELKDEEAMLRTELSEVNAVRHRLFDQCNLFRPKILSRRRNSMRACESIQSRSMMPFITTV